MKNSKERMNRSATVIGLGLIMGGALAPQPGQAADLFGAETLGTTGEVRHRLLHPVKPVLASSIEASCGEHTCGEAPESDASNEDKAAEATCGETPDAETSEEGKATEATCGEHTCGESPSNEDKTPESTCGEHTCGSN